MRKQNKKTINGLNLLRAIALIGVFFYHAYPQHLRGGYFGVITFFVISGYLTALTTNQTKFNLFDYYKKRFLRLYPALIIVIFSTLGVLGKLDMFKMANTPQEVLSILFGYNNFWQIKMNASYFTQLTNTSPFTHLWYLAILIQFDFAWPLVLFVYRLLRRFSKGIALLLFFICTVATCVILPYRFFTTPTVNLTALYYSTATRIFSLLVGAFFGLMRSENKTFRIFRFKNAMSALIWFIVYLVVTIYFFIKAEGTLHYVYQWAMVFYTWFTALTIEVINLNPLPIFKQEKISSVISKYSYEFYLWQYPILFLFGISPWKNLPYLFFLELFVMILLSWWTYHFTEKIKRI